MTPRRLARLIGALYVVHLMGWIVIVAVDVVIAGGSPRPSS